MGGTKLDARRRVRLGLLLRQRHQARRSGRRAPVGGLTLVLVLSLGLVGMGYGLWSKLLRVEGIVHTGRVDAKWLGVVCTEFHTWPDLPDGPEDYGEFEGKDVGRTTARIDSLDDQIIHLVVTNGYPSYAVDCELHFEIEGTIPVIIRGTTIIPVSPNLTNCALSGYQSKRLTCDQLTVEYTDGIGSQIHPGDRLASSLILHVEQPSDQNATYEFKVLHCMAQWNELVTAEECFGEAP
jgi:hypothetical protein